MSEGWIDYDGGDVQERHRNAQRIRVEVGVTVIPAGAFQDCGNLRALDLSNVTTISAWAFYRCRSLDRVVWTTASAVEIGERAFAYCKRLREIDLSNVTKIGAFAFWECFALKRVAIPSSVSEIEAAVFLDCDGLMEVEINEGLLHIGTSAFERCASLVRVSIPSTTLNVGNGAFARCRQLRHVALPEGLQILGERAFRECRSLERIAIPSSDTMIGIQAFWNCCKLSEVVLREGIHCIRPHSFDGCASLEHINIPPTAFVIDIERSSYQLMGTTMPVPGPREIRLVVSKWLQHRSQSQLAQAESKVNEILSRPQQTADEKTQCIREWFAYYDMLDVTTMLELAIWRVNMNGNEEDNTEVRQAGRRNCGSDMSVIIPGVLPYLEE